MGLGFVMLIWLVVFIILAIPISAILYLSARSFSKSATKKLRKKRSIIAGALPFALIAYFGCAFILYGYWCLSVRNVDPGIGDGWVVPVGNDYTMEMIDTPENAFIHKNNEAHIEDIRLLGKAKPYVFGRSADGYFILNVESGELYQADSQYDFEKGLQERGVFKTGILETPQSFYRKSRWRIADLIAAIIIFAIPAIGLYLVWRNYWRMPKRIEVPSYPNT